MYKFSGAFIMEFIGFGRKIVVQLCNNIINLAKQGYCIQFVCLCVCVSVCLCVCVSVCVSVCPRSSNTWYFMIS